MDWAIVTPEVTIRYQEGRVALHAVESLRPHMGDPLEELWTTYYSNIFNPARLKVDAMRAEMPRKYWRNLPEARAIPSLIAGARGRVVAMQAAERRPARAAAHREEEMAKDLFAEHDTLEEARAAATACTLCPLHQDATQVVFGEGPRDAPIMIVGEQPGDREDLAGRPFVGPAGQLFDEVAEMAGLDRSRCYVTNSVKHFKFVQKGKRRIHQKPAASEIRACATWLETELSLVDPKVVVAMGATALHALTGKGQGILKRRGTVEATKDGRPLLITVHPSYLLRLPDPALKAEQTERFRDDLARVGMLLNS
jgi:DNA polymerase